MPDPLAKPNRPKPNPLEGAALIIVLSCLVLLAALAIGLLNRVEADRTNASAYRGSTLTRNLSEYAINIVMAQISAATKSDPTLAWASQPGAIRTYSASGSTISNIYKLYSSTNMVVTTFPSGDTNLSGWTNNTALYTDLNAPVVSSARTNYPILDPSAVGSVQGFDIIGAPTTTTQPAPMPVNWLYVLEDGTLVAPTSTAGNNTVTVASATAANPIVGRIAFWTDDDTSKININTASGAPWNYTNTSVSYTYAGTSTNISMPANYWDTPLIGSAQDRNLAVSLPWQGEYQRYPGHPSTVSLSAVFTNLTTNGIMQVSPRVTYDGGGSQWGSFVQINTGTTAKLADDAARLYANVDELLFATNRTTGTNPITPQQLEQARFFLTASSRAPDVTLFNTPRILCWPITFTTGNSTKITPYDRLIAFCGTVGANTNIGSTNSYYFTRWNPDSATADYNVARNRTLISYLTRLTETPVPGFGGTGILAKYTTPQEPDQIRTQIFDYIRCINTQDTSITNNNSYWYAPLNSGCIIMPTAGANNTLGFGRFPTVSKVGIMFWHNDTNVVAGITNATLCAQLLWEIFTPSYGYPEPTGNPSNIPQLVFSGLDNLRWGSNSSNLTSIFSNTPYRRNAFDSGGSEKMGGRYSVVVNTRNPLMNSSTNFPTNSTAEFYFSGGNISISVCDRNATFTNQQINVYLPPITNQTVPISNTINSNFNSSSLTNRVNTGVLQRPFFYATDVAGAVGVSHGDFRLTAASANVSTNAFSPVPGYDMSRVAHNFLEGGYWNGDMYGSRYASNNYYVPSSLVIYTNSTTGNNPWKNGGDIASPTANATATGDFDNASSLQSDGPFIGFADEGNARVDGTIYPYFATNGTVTNVSPGFFSPNRLVPSAGIMGSLPTGVKSQTPWQTLLFRPAAVTVSTHPGKNNPPDYLLLDLFNMPVVEPYAISEPLSTAGRVNMNYQILPFTYIKRSTAVQAALHTERLLALPSNGMTNQQRANTSSTNFNSRWPLNLNTNTGTLRGFEDRFGNNDIFRSAAEICSIPLVPTNSTWTDVTNGTFWPNYALTGDNSKERPYARIYPKLTTKSNTYTVHYRVEVLKKSPNSTSQNTWADGTDKVISTYRGSTTIERYVNPRDPALPDYASITTLPPTGANALPNFYKFRILGERQFNP